eukprot:1798442-Prymnesium_polylepis.1
MEKNALMRAMRQRKYGQLAHPLQGGVGRGALQPRGRHPAGSNRELGCRWLQHAEKERRSCTSQIFDFRHHKKESVATSVALSSCTSTVARRKVA